MRSTLLKRLSEGDGRDAVCGEDPGGDAVLNSGQRYEHVLWAHRAVARLCRRQLKRLLEPSGDAPAGAGRSVERARTERLFNAAGHLVKVDAAPDNVAREPEPRERLSGARLRVLGKREQDVLRADEVLPEGAALLCTG